ncbi:hypothetical protein [Algoriphagus boritolerans]|uniref:Outer membrane protein beta-barrel domain-containing protein n=1 Tax=Algoriphagus boritolerans DSM 17298 = JCM 18970 TaxID=1120964 RepID=A0A1H5XT66_9BACT|nr:hypothetical protein [Algoriphagus boritolerans]SEG14868.1 hypothetical protein SAMN03080598_02659 [Algoriphagus boritolerans DSM 17298 = JCM 18970]
MFKNVLIILLLFLALQSKVYPQSTINLSFGFPKINWDYSGNFDGLRTVYRNGWSITASGLKIKKNGFIYGIDLGVNRYGNGFQFEFMRYDLKEIHHFSILPLIGYEHHLRETKFSVRFNSAFGIGIIPIENKFYESDSTFQIRRVVKQNADGSTYSVPLYDLTFSGSQEIKSRIFPLIKPNIELHYSIGGRSTLFAKGTLGISLVEDVIVRDFPEIIYESEEYQVTHSTSLSYSCLEIGYSYRVK